MKNLEFEERILRTCQIFMSQGIDRFKMDYSAGEKLMKDLDDYLDKDLNLKKLLKRGDSDNLSDHWKQTKDQGEAQISKLLREDQIMSLNVSSLIESMRNLDMRTPYDFKNSCNDIKEIEDTVMNFLKAEVAYRLRKQLAEPRFQEKVNPQLEAFQLQEKRPKGLLTRVKEGDKTLRDIKNDWTKNGAAFSEKNAYRETRKLMMERITDADDLVFMLQTRANQSDSARRFVLSEHSQENQKLVARLEKTVESVEMSRELRTQAYLSLSFIGYGLKHTLKACGLLLDLHDTCPFNGKKVRIERLINYLKLSEQYKKADKLNDSLRLKKPDFYKDVFKKANTMPLFDQANHLIDALAGDDSDSMPSDEWCDVESQPTALENLFVLAGVLIDIASFHQQLEEASTMEQLFSCKWVLEQSVYAYRSLLALLDQAKKLVAKSEGREKEMLTFIFDCFSKILLNNLSALYESERAYLDIVFACDKKLQTTSASDYVQKEYYPQLLKLLVWRTTLSEEDQAGAVKYLSPWQSLLPIVDASVIEAIYVEVVADQQVRDDLVNKHKFSYPLSYDFEGQLPQILESLDLENSKENEQRYRRAESRAQEFTRAAIKQKSPCAGAIIQQSFKAVVEMDNKTLRQGKALSINIAESLSAQLFLASDASGSKISNVVRDLIQAGVKFQLNDFTITLLKMLTADSVNILKNVKELDIKNKNEKKVKQPWKAVLQNTELVAGDNGDQKPLDFSKLEKSFEGHNLPKIVEIGFYVTTFLAGVYVEYSDGTTYEAKGSTGDAQTYKSLKLNKNEYIKSVTGRQGSWTDQLTVWTNQGRSLVGGGDGGNKKEPIYPQNCYVIGFQSWRFHHHLTRIQVAYVNLDEMGISFERDPIVALITESDLLSKGIEQRHMSVFSQQALDEIKKVQAVTGSQVVDDNIESSQKSTDAAAAEEDTAPSTATSMINTMAGGEIGASEDLMMQLIHSGQNEILDEFIQVLQLMLRESREPIRTQLNILQDRGLQATRACFAVIVKLSGLAPKLEAIVENLDLRALDFEGEGPQRIKEMKEACKEEPGCADVQLLLKEWCNATKMRKWLKDSIGQEEDSPILQDVVKKAEFLIKLENPSHFQSLDPKQELFELSYKIPSYARDNKKDEDELSETDDNGKRGDLWREHYQSWKTDLKRQGTLRSHSQKLTEIRKIGTSAILVCLQHQEVTGEMLRKVVETNFINSCYRMMGLQLLEFVIQLIMQMQGADDKPPKTCLVAVQNVAAALNFGIRCDSDEPQSHYMDGIKSCGAHLESLIRKSFFSVVRGISEFFRHAPKNQLLTLLSSLDWSFKARDFEELLTLKAFKLLHTGVNRKLENAEGQTVAQNIVLESWQLRPADPLTERLQIMSSNLYMSIVSRLAEPEARKIIFSGLEKQATGVGSLSRATSAVNVNAAQALLAEEFSIMFREFHEFIIMASKMKRYISLDFLNLYRRSREDELFLSQEMPALANEVMSKIIQNAPYDDQEESKTGQSRNIKLQNTTLVNVSSAQPEEVKVGVLNKEQSWREKLQELKAARQAALKKPKKIYDLNKYTQEQIEVLEALDNNQSLSTEQQRIHQEIQDMQESDTLAGMFDEEEEEEGKAATDYFPEVEIVEKVPALDARDPQIPVLRQKIVQYYRTFKERVNIDRYLNLVLIFVKIATKATYPLEMLQNVANPYFIKILLQMLFQVSPRSKLQILTIFQTLLRIQVPISIFDEGVSDLKAKFRTEGCVEFGSAFTKFLFQAALQIQAKTWDSTFSEEKRGGMYDVSVQLTRTVALCIKISDMSFMSEHSLELSQACSQMCSQELFPDEAFTLMQVLQATCTMPVIGDTILQAEKNNEDGIESQPQTASMLLWKDLNKPVDVSSLILPEYVPDSQIPLKLQGETLENLVQRLCELAKTLSTLDFAQTLQVIYIVKLLLLQQASVVGGAGLRVLSNETRMQLMMTLAAISGDRKADDVIIRTSAVEYSLAAHLRDGVEQIFSSGIDPFEEKSTFMTASEAAEESKSKVTDLKVRSRKSTIAKKTNSAGSKYSKQLLSEAKKKRNISTQGLNKSQKQQVLLNNIFKDVFATVDEIVEMNQAVVEYCNRSGCSLLEVLYGINEALSAEKKYQTADQVIEFYNEWLERLAENEDADKDFEIEQQFVDLLTKKLEKVLSIHKPEPFKKDVLSSINLEQAVNEVEQKTHGLSKLMHLRVQDFLTGAETARSSGLIKLNMNQFKKKLSDDLKERSAFTEWPLVNGQLQQAGLNKEDKLKCAQILARRFSEKLVFELFDPAVDTVNGAVVEDGDIADVMAGQQSFSLQTCYNQVFMYVRSGLTSFAKSLELLACNGGIECQWEVAYSQNFLTESKLTSEFESLRQLEKPAITRSMLKVNSQETLARLAEELLNDKLLEAFQTSDEMKEKGEKFLGYLLQKIIAQTLDDYAFKLEQKPRLTSSLVSAVSKQLPAYVSSWDLIERVKLLNSAVLKQQSEKLRIKLSPDLFNLTMLTILQEKTGVDQKRLLVEDLFQIVMLFDSNLLREGVEAGSWGRISQSSLFCDTHKKIVMEDNLDNLNILCVLLFDLELLIRKIDKRAAQFDLSKAAGAVQAVKNKDGPAQSTLKKVKAVLDGTDLGTRLIEQVLSADAHSDVFNKQFTVDVKNEECEQTLDFGFADGVKAQFQIALKEAEESKEPANAAASIQDYSFELRYKTVDADGKEEWTERTLYAGEEIEPVDLKQSLLQMSCTAKRSQVNIAALNDGQMKFKGVCDSQIKYVLKSASREFLYFVSDQSIHRLKRTQAAGECLIQQSKKLTLPEGLNLSEQRLTAVEQYGKVDAYIAADSVWLLKEDGTSEHWTTIADKKIVKTAINGNVMVFINEDGIIHQHGLFSKITQDSEASSVADSELIQFKPADLSMGGQDGDKFVDIQIGGSLGKKFAMTTIEKAGKRKLCSHGCGEGYVLGREMEQQSEMKILPSQTIRSDFQRVFLFETISFAVDSRGRLFIIGGKLPRADDSVFPRMLTNTTECFSELTFTTLHVKVKDALKLPEATQITVVDMDYTPQVMLIKYEVRDPGAESSKEILISLSAEEGEPYAIKKLDVSDAFLHEGKIWSLKEPIAQDQEGAAQPPCILKVDVKPIVRDLKNISPAMIAQVDPSSPLVEDLTKVEKLRKDENAINKVFITMNSWINTKVDDRMIQQDDLEKMIEDTRHEGELNEIDKRNPIKKCWNEQLSQQSVQQLVGAIGQMNIDQLKISADYKKMREIVCNDPFLDDTMQRQLQNQGSQVVSLNLALKFKQGIQFQLMCIQDEAFSQAWMPEKHNEDLIGCQLYRFKAAQVAIDGKVDRGDGDTLFTQVFSEMKRQQPKNWKLQWRKEGNDSDRRNRVFRANFQDEGSIDAGGPYREAMENLSRELCSSVLPVLVPTENQNHEHGMLRECWVLNHDARSEAELDQVYKFGLIIGFAIRSKQAWNMNLHPILWKQIVGAPLDPDQDLKTSDKFMHQMFESMRQYASSAETDADFQAMVSDQCFTIDTGFGETELVAGGATMPVTRDNLEQYIKMASMKILKKADDQLRNFLSGVHYVVPKEALSRLSWQNAEIRAMGIPTVDIDLLRKNTSQNVNYGEEWYKWYWEVMEEMEEEDKRLYLKFVFGRSKLTSTFGRRHEINQQGGGDKNLPQSHTCFFQIDMPKYTSKEIMRTRILTAVRFCGEIDTD